MSDELHIIALVGLLGLFGFLAYLAWLKSQGEGTVSTAMLKRYGVLT